MKRYDDTWKEWNKQVAEAMKAQKLEDDKTTSQLLCDFDFPVKFIDDAHEEYGDLWDALRTLVTKYQKLQYTLEEAEDWIESRPF